MHNKNASYDNNGKIIVIAVFIGFSRASQWVIYALISPVRVERFLPGFLWSFYCKSLF